jgi:hypothetical protein
MKNSIKHVLIGFGVGLILMTGLAMAAGNGKPVTNGYGQAAR